MRWLLIYILLLGAQLVLSQGSCFLSNGKMSGSDEPPGCVICDFDFEGNTQGFSPDNFSFDFPCGEIENSQWFKVYPIGNRLNIEISTKNCENDRGVEAALYDKDFNLVSNCGSSQGFKERISIVSNVRLTPIEPYYLMIDGYENDNCIFDVSIEGGNSVFESSVTGLDIQFDDARLCVGSKACFSIMRDPFAWQYEWSVDTDAELVSGGGRLDTFACYWLNANQSTVVCDLSYPCSGKRIERPVFVSSERFVSMNLFSCQGRCAPFKDTCFNLGRHNLLVENDSLTCDSMFSLNVEREGVFPSPEIKCAPRSNGVAVSWLQLSGADEYIVSIDRDSFATVNGGSILLNDFPADTTFNIKIQPKGACTYLPGEFTCALGTSNLSANFLNNEITVYPNPTTGKINIETDLKIESVEVFDLAGRFLQKEKTTSFELENRNAGVYFLKIKTNQGVGMKRILVSSK